MIIDEMLNNEPLSEEEIEESFDAFNFITESISKENIKEIINGGDKKYKDELDKLSSQREKETNKIEDKYKKIEDEFNKKPYDKRDYDELNKQNRNKFQELVKLNNKYDKLRTELANKADEKSAKALTIKSILSIYNEIKRIIRMCSNKDIVGKLIMSYGKGNACQQINNMATMNIKNCLSSFVKPVKKINMDDDIIKICEILKLQDYGIEYDKNEVELQIKDTNKFYSNLVSKILISSGYYTNPKNLKPNLDDIETILNSDDEVPDIDIKTPKKEEVKKGEEIVKDKENEDNTTSNDDKDTDKTEVQTPEEQEEEIKNAISDNKDLLSPIAKEANVTGDQLLSVITKLCKGQKIDEITVRGLSIMICGALLSVKKSGKGNKKAVAAVADKIAKIVGNKKRGIRDIIK